VLDQEDRQVSIGIYSKRRGFLGLATALHSDDTTSLLAKRTDCSDRLVLDWTDVKRSISVLLLLFNCR